MYPREFNVKWEHLSTDTQDRIKVLKTHTLASAENIQHNAYAITPVENEIDKFYHEFPKVEKKLEEYIKLLENQMAHKVVNKTDIPYTTENATDILKYGNSLYGQIAKIKINNQNKVTASDYVIPCRIASNATEKSTEFGDPPRPLQDVYSEWIKWAHYDQRVIPIVDIDNYDLDGKGQAPNGYQLGRWRRGVERKNQNIISAGTTALNSWSYTASTDTLSCNIDTAFTSGFINPEEIGPNDYIFEIKVDTMGDYDHVGVVVGYMKDTFDHMPDYYNLAPPDPIEHTLSIVRAKNNKQTYMLVYDLGWTSQYIITDLSTSMGISTGAGNIVYIKVIKRYDELEFGTTHFSTGSDTTYSSYQKFSIPFQKPKAWSAAMYQNIKEMLRNSSRVGLITRSNKAKFNILQQKYVTDTENYVYSLYENKVYEYKYSSSAWSVLGTLDDYLEPRTFLANPRNGHLYFYYQNGIYRQVG